MSALAEAAQPGGFLFSGDPLLLVRSARLACRLRNERRDFLQRPYVIRDARLHGRRHAQRLVDAAEIIVHEMQRHRVRVVLDLL